MTRCPGSQAAVAAALVVLVGSLSCSSREGPADRRAAVLGGHLDPGAYSVGFATRSAGGDGGEPVAVSLWYPAAGKRDARYLTLRDYYRASGGNDPAGRLAEVEAAAGEQGVSADDLRRGLDARGRAQLDLDPAPGRFPVVAISPGAGGPAFHLPLLCEYLASRGLVVAAVPSLQWTATEATGAAALQLAAARLQQAVRAGREQPGAAADRLGVLGYSFGGSVAVLAAMARDDVGAVVAVDPGFRVAANFELMRKTPGFGPTRLTAPLLVLLARGVAQEPDLRLLAAAPSGSLVVSFPALRHGDFSSLVDELFVFSAGPASGRDLGRIAAGHDAAASYAAAFLLAHLADEAEARRFLASDPTENGIGADVARVDRRLP